MRHSPQPSVLISICLLGVALAGTARAQTDGLTLVSLRTPAHTARYDFGRVSLLDDPQLVHTFLLRNDSLVPLPLVGLIPSCHCTTATVEPDGALPTLAPGQQVSVRVSIVTEPYLTGFLLKSVAVYAEGIPEPVATLEMAATLRPGVTWTPAAVDFGTAAAGQERFAAVTVSLDPRLLPNGKAPRLVASDPDIQVTPEVESGTEAGQTGTFRTIVYRVRLAPDAALGAVHDLLRYASSGLADGPTVPVDGQVVGAATVSPPTLAFGGVRQGHSAVLPLRLNARTAGLWRAACVVTDRPWVVAHLTPARSPHRTLNVTLTPDAPAGPVQSQVTVTLANGQRLRVPVTAYVTTSRLP